MSKTLPRNVRPPGSQSAEIFGREGRMIATLVLPYN